MHLPDSFINAQTSIPLLGAAFLGVAHAFRQVRKTVLEKVHVMKAKLATVSGEMGGEANIELHLSHAGKEKMKRMPAVGSLIFALQMVNFSIGGGISGHLLGGVLGALIAGPFEALLVITVILATQALVFADGGILALGANIINMGLVGAIGGYYLYASSKRYLGQKASIAIAAWTSVMLAATAVSLELAASGTVTLGVVLPAMLGYHALIGIGEALITVGVIVVLTKYGYPMFFSESSE
jgi:cobalt/nickel transport system permease protein